MNESTFGKGCGVHEARRRAGAGYGVSEESNQVGSLSGATISRTEFGDVMNDYEQAYCRLNDLLDTLILKINPALEDLPLMTSEPRVRQERSAPMNRLLQDKVDMLNDRADYISKITASVRL